MQVEELKLGANNQPVTEVTPEVDGGNPAPQIDETKAFSERLKKERVKLEKEFQEKTQRELNAVAKGQGFEDWQELQNYREKQQIESLGVTDEEQFKQYVETLIENDPRVKSAAELSAIAAKEAIEKQVQADLDEIMRLNPDVKSIDDLMKLPNYEALYEKVNNNYTLLDAYKLTHEVAYDTRSHMTSNKGGKGQQIFVPDDIYATYKKNFPAMTDAEIRESFKKYGGK